MLEKYTSAYPDICVKLEGEGPPEPVRLRTTEMVADFGSGFDCGPIKALFESRAFQLWVMLGQ